MYTLLLTLFGVPIAHAAADPTLVNATESMATATKDNVLGVLGSTTVIGAIGLFLAISIAVVWVMRFTKKAAK